MWPESESHHAGITRLDARCVWRPGGHHIIDELSRGSLGTLPAAELSDLHARLVKAWSQGNEAEACRLFMIRLPLLNFQAIIRMRMTKTILVHPGVLHSAFVRGAGPRMDAEDSRELTTMLDQIGPEFSVYPLVQSASVSTS